MAIEELQDWLGTIKDLAWDQSKWLLRYTNVHVYKHEELIPIIVVAKVYRAKVKKGKKAK